MEIEVFEMENIKVSLPIFSSFNNNSTKSYKTR